MTDSFSSAFDDVLAQACTPQAVRGIEHGGPWQPLWDVLQDSGFADALVPEPDGGAGLALRDVFGVFERCGAHAVPVPFAETMLARALLAAAGVERPAGPITFTHAQRHAGGWRSDVAPAARTASHVLVQAGDTWRLLEVAAARADGAGFVLDLSLDWPEAAWRDAVRLTLPDDWRGATVRRLQACVYAAQLAGAAGRVFDMTLAYANQRQQFGRVIGKFQAVQHHLAVMAEQVAAARLAAEIGCLSTTAVPDALPAAIGKARSSEAALEVARVGHAIHGAIGFTEELDLQLFTRRLHAWRRAGGSESTWHDAVGRAVVDGHDGAAIELVCRTLAPFSETLA